MPSDGRMANTMTAAGLRASGQVELAAPEAAPDWRRAEILLAHLLRSYPGLPDPMPPSRVERWMGCRPSTPDGLPVIGPSRSSPDILHAFGHGHVGLAAGPITGRIVADLVAGRDPPVAAAGYAAERFRREPRAR
jgi:D-amino-acid dehydrogenase